MTFLKIINRQYVFSFGLMLLLVSTGGYILLQSTIDNEIKEDIAKKEAAIISQIKTQKNSLEIYPIIETKKISFKEIEPKAYTKIFMMDEVEDESEPYLEYTNSVKIDGQWFLIKIRHSLWETNELLLAIALPLFALLILVFLFSFLFTKKLNQRLWSDFKANLKQLENYSIRAHENLSLTDSHIEEFDRLNQSIRKMTKKMRDDYFSLQEFTENASHEIQTPITIALLNLDELLQHKKTEAEFKKVLATIKALKRLSLLNQSLLLLTKIENDQFASEELLNFNELMQEKVHEFKTLLESKKIQVEWVINEQFIVKINPQLADMIIGNLLSNAINHNIISGEIHISFKQNSFKICNSGPGNSLDNHSIFNRFTKEKSNSHGLGLAIVKKICEKNHLQINYSKGLEHCFNIKKILAK